MTQRSVLHLREGEWAYIQSLEELDLTCRLLTLGVLPKSKVQLVRKAPFGGAYYLKINENCVAVRTEEAKHILID
ncbi:MAG: ferrous iron transport protein A [Saprospiraceae bacterium]|nr:ferrous iron transport protein A [Saprospiraceae bacterium]